MIPRRAGNYDLVSRSKVALHGTLEWESGNSKAKSQYLFSESGH